MGMHAIEDEQYDGTFRTWIRKTSMGTAEHRPGE